MEQDGGAPHKGEDYYCFTTEDPWVDSSILQELCHSFRLFFYQREQPKGIKRYCMFKLV